MVRDNVYLSRTRDYEQLPLPDLRRTTSIEFLKVPVDTGEAHPSWKSPIGSGPGHSELNKPYTVPS